MPKPSLKAQTLPSQIDDQTRSFALHMAAVRRSRSMTLDVLAQMTGLNKGYLSRLERNEKNPSIATVLKISQALDVSVSALFGEVVDDTLIHVVRASDRQYPLSEKGDSRFEPLSRSNSGIEAFMLFPNKEFGSDGRVDHGGTEIILVVSGQIEIQFADRTILLNVGDFLQFPGHIAHQLRSPKGKGSALVAVTREK